MTHQYESEILNKLMERDGFNIPSSVPPYEAEIKAYLINQVKQAYPKLTDYEAEWLLYNYTKHLPADFPISSVSNVTEASFENVVPFAYQNAILKGNTLVNLIDYTEFPYSSNIFNNDFHLKYELKTNTTYTIIVDINLNGGEPDTFGLGLLQYGVDWASNNGQYVNGLNKIKLTTNNLIANYLRIRGDGIIVNYAIVIEGDYTNVDIPYFDGMQSVKMPVLTTTGKNLFNKEAFYNDWKSKVENYVYKEFIDNEEVLKVNNSHHLYDDNKGFRINVKKDVPLTIRMEYKKAGAKTTNAIFVIRYGDNKTLGFPSCGSDEWKTNATTFIPTRDYITVCSGYNSDEYFYVKNIQLEEGSTATPYEPYQSNILTVNDDVTLRGIDDVKDELNLLTGEVTYMLSEKRLTSELAWEMFPSWQTDELMTFGVTDINWGVGLVCNRFIKGDGGSVMGTTDRAKRSFYAHATGWFICLYKNELSEVSVQGFKEWLDNNETNIVYKLPQQSVKTVDLSVIDQDGKTLNQIKPLEGTMHLSTSGENIRPLFSGEIPVEAITQNLASFIDLEVEE